MPALRRRQRPWLRVVALATTLAALPRPVLAAEPTTSPLNPSPPLLSELIRQAVADSPASALCASDAPAQAQAPAPAQTGAQAPANTPAKGGGEKPSKWSFFKTPAGVAVMATVAAGLGYTLYSMQHDRVSSPGKQ